MLFLQREVENEERIAMAVNGFSTNKESPKDRVRQKQRYENKDVVTASTLLTTKDNKTIECVFCGENHGNSSCEKARKMSLNERLDIVKQKNACYSCAKTEHSSRFCKLNVKCAWCGRRHILLMCRAVNSESTKTTESTEESTKPTNSTETATKTKPVESNLANLSWDTEIFLPTLRVRIYNGEKEFVVRAVLDTGSHRSYILTKLANELNYEEISQCNVIHALFGGSKSESVEHKVHRICLSSVDDKYACNFIALNKKTICCEVPGVKGGPWVRELENKGIQLTDVDLPDEPVSVLMGADVMGKLITGKMLDLDCGASAMETRLG